MGEFQDIAVWGEREDAVEQDFGVWGAKKGGGNLSTGVDAEGRKKPNVLPGGAIYQKKKKQKTPFGK